MTKSIVHNFYFLIIIKLGFFLDKIQLFMKKTEIIGDVPMMFELIE